MDFAQETEFSGVDSKLVIKQGWVKMRSKNMGLSMMWKKRWIALMSPSSKGPTRLVKYSDDKKAAEEEQLSETKLQDVVSVVRMAMEDRPGITLQMSDHSTKQFYCLSDADANEWLQKLQKEARKSGHLPPGMFPVFLLPSPNLNFYGECVVEVTASDINVYEDHARPKNSKIATWPISSIRRYGSDPKKQRILIEVGRLCPTGEGVYLLRSVYHKDIHELLDKEAKKLHKRNSNTGSLTDDSPPYVNGHPSR